MVTETVALSSSAGESTGNAATKPEVTIVASEIRKPFMLAIERVPTAWEQGKASRRTKEDTKTFKVFVNHVETGHTA
jgi:hypothetical protein